MSEKGRIYFASDLHLGAPDPKSSRQRESRFIHWLERAHPDMEALYLLGDVFDMWFEYGKVVPRGYVRLLGKLAEIADEGIPIHFFIGNHDMWVFDYLPNEIGMTLHKEPVRTELKGHRMLLGHGDGLGPGDKGYKFIKKVFRNRLAKGLFRWTHPDIGLPIAHYFSKSSREGGEEEFQGEENEWLLQYCKEVLSEEAIDLFVFGHRHLPLDLTVESAGRKARYINLGDWLHYDSYAVLDEEGIRLEKFGDEGN